MYFFNVDKDQKETPTYSTTVIFSTNHITGCRYFVLVATATHKGVTAICCYLTCVDSEGATSTCLLLSVGHLHTTVTCGFLFVTSTHLGECVALPSPDEDRTLNMLTTRVVCV